MGAIRTSISPRPIALPNRSGYEVKATTLRGYIAQLDKLGVLAEVMARVPEETRRAMEAPPLPSAWIDGMEIEDLISALESLRGLDAVRTVTKGGQEAVILPILRPILTGLLRLFGASPATLMSRWPDFTKTAVRSINFKWERDSERSGRLIVTFPRKNIPRSAFVGMESGCSLILDLCGVRGTVAATQISDEGTTGTIQVSW